LLAPTVINDNHLGNFRRLTQGQSIRLRSSRPGVELPSQ